MGEGEKGRRREGEFVACYCRLSSILRLFSAAHEPFEAAFERGAGEEDFVLAGGAAHTDFRANSHNHPLIAATRMGLAGLHNIANSNFNRCRHRRVGRTENRNAEGMFPRTENNISDERLK